MNQYLFTTFDNAQIKQGQAISYTWQQLVVMIRNNCKADSANKHFSPFIYRDSFKSKENAIQVACLILDNPELDRWQQYQYFCYPADRHTSRMIVPLHKPISIKDYLTLQEHWDLASPDTVYPLAMSCPHQDKLHDGDSIFDWEKNIPSPDEPKDNISAVIENIESFMHPKDTVSEEALEMASSDHEKLNKTLAWLKSLGQNPIRTRFIYNYSPRGLKIRNKTATLAVMNALETLKQVRQERKGRSTLWHLVA